MTFRNRTRSIPPEAMTKADYDALELDRPLTDKPIGATTDHRRKIDAAASEAITAVLGVGDEFIIEAERNRKRRRTAA